MLNKRLILSLLFLAVIIVISACGGGGGNEENGGTEEGAGGEGGETTAQGDAANGATIYENNCLSCHGQEGAGGSAPGLQSVADYDAVVQQVKNGGGGMPAFEGQLSEQEIADVSAYITEEIASGE